MDIYTILIYSIDRLFRKLLEVHTVSSFVRGNIRPLSNRSLGGTDRFPATKKQLYLYYYMLPQITQS